MPIKIVFSSSSGTGGAGPGDINLDGTSAIYIGDSGTNGTWKIVISGTTLSMQRRESGSYVEKGAFTP